MFTRTRIVALLTILGLLAVCGPFLGAYDAATAPAHVAGFFESHYWLIEIMVLAFGAISLVVGMSANRTTRAVETTHHGYWSLQPRGRSYTHIPVPTEPSSPATIKRTLLIVGVIYFILRLTCLSAFFTTIYQLIGEFVDIFFS